VVSYSISTLACIASVSIGLEAFFAFSMRKKWGKSKSARRGRGCKPYDFEKPFIHIIWSKTY